MAQKFNVEGFEAFINTVDSLKIAKPNDLIFVLFSGSKDAATGKSWCPDCVVAEPVIEAALSKAPVNSAFIYVNVGERSFWKDPKCVFRTDSRTKLKSVPTLVNYGNPERLEEEQCANSQLVEMLFEDA